MSNPPTPILTLLHIRSGAVSPNTHHSLTHTCSEGLSPPAGRPGPRWQSLRLCEAEGNERDWQVQACSVCVRACGKQAHTQMHRRVCESIVCVASKHRCAGVSEAAPMATGRLLEASTSSAPALRTTHRRVRGVGTPVCALVCFVHWRWREACIVPIGFRKNQMVFHTSSAKAIA